jgi:hypothetical protein
MHAQEHRLTEESRFHGLRRVLPEYFSTVKRRQRSRHAIKRMRGAHKVVGDV